MSGKPCLFIKGEHETPQLRGILPRLRAALARSTASAIAGEQVSLSERLSASKFHLFSGLVLHNVWISQGSSRKITYMSMVCVRKTGEFEGGGGAKTKFKKKKQKKRASVRKRVFECVGKRASVRKRVR